MVWIKRYRSKSYWNSDDRAFRSVRKWYGSNGIVQKAIEIVMIVFSVVLEP